MPEEWAVEAHALQKRYGEIEAVAGIDFRVDRGECFGLLGPNGAGKTTTVRMIQCFSPVSAGELRVLGLDARREQRRIKARLGVVPQEDSLDLELSVVQNLLVYARYFGLRGEPARKRAAELLEFAGLTERAGARAEHLSGGMKRRLTIARALVNTPDLVILDEPTTGLDPEARHLVWQKLRSLRAAGVTLLLTTHYMEEARQLCDRLVIMDRGRILAEGAPGALVAQEVGREVLEAAPVQDPAPLLGRLGGLVNGYRLVGDTLFLFVRDGLQALAALQEDPQEYTHQLLRPATLEDVFLKLTGRGLDHVA